MPGGNDHTLPSPGLLIMRIFRRFFSVLVFLFILGDLRPQGIGFSDPSDFVYTPLVNDEGYLQAWNVNFRGSGYFIYITYIISNIGPGTLNNGVSVLVYQGGQSRVWTAEYSIRSLQASPGRFGIVSGTNHLQLNGGAYDAKVDINNLKIQLRLMPIASGVRLSGGKIPVSSDSSRFIRADIPVGLATATGSISIDGKPVELTGFGGLEYLMTNESPHSYAKKFALIRSYSGDNAVYIGGFWGTSSFPGGRLIRYAITKAGKITRSGNVIDVLSSEFQRDPLSGYDIPAKTVYRLDGGGSCTLTEERLYSTGGYYILSHISAFLRFVIRILFARPFILQYMSKVTFQCEGDSAAAVVFNYTQSSYYLIND